MGFFQEIFPLIPKNGSLAISIASTGENLIVTVLPKFPALSGDGDMKASVKPTLLRGSAQELDEQLSGLMHTEIEARQSLYQSVKTTIDEIEAQKKTAMAKRDKSKHFPPPVPEPKPPEPPEPDEQGFSFDLPKNATTETGA